MLKLQERSIAGFRARTASVMLAFGLLFLSAACTTQPLVEDAKLNLAKQNYNQALKQLQKAIQEKPENAEAYYYRGYIQLKLAQGKSNPAKRKQNYTVMHDALTKAKTLFEEQNRAPKESLDIDPLLQSQWSREHNAGVKILKENQDEANANEKKLTLAIAHLNNATILIPDSLISHQMLVLAYEQIGETEQLLSSLKYLRQHADDKLSDEFNSRIARALLKEGLTDSAYTYYQKHSSSFGRGSSVPVELSERYIEQNNHQRAIELLTQLKKEQPDSVSYLINLGAQQYLFARSQATQLTQALQTRFDSLSSQDSSFNATTIDELSAQQRDTLWTDSLSEKLTDIGDLLAEAEFNYIRAGTLSPDDIKVLTGVGTYFHNASRLFSNLTPYVYPDERAELQSRVRDYLTTALPYLERVAEEQPDNTTIWKALYHAYSYMSMTSKADAAFQKAGL